jgi:hypothetical protein
MTRFDRANIQGNEEVLKGLIFEILDERERAQVVTHDVHVQIPVHQGYIGVKRRTIIDLLRLLPRR